MVYLRSVDAKKVKIEFCLYSKNDIWAIQCEREQAFEKKVCRVRDISDLFQHLT